MPLVARSVADLARSPELRVPLDWFRRERAWINEQHVKLCRIAAPTFLEEKRAEWMAERFRELGWEARLDRSGNVVASLPGRRDSPTVAVTAHLDTVLAPRAPEEIKLSGDGRLLGPGVSDNGAGLTALLALAAAWTAAPPLPDALLAPVLIANVGEEGEGNLSGMRFLCRDANVSRPKAFLVLDGPNTDHITCRALASRRFEVTITGPGGHSWSDYGAGNPIHALSRVIAEFAAAAPSDPTPRSSFNFGLVQGGTSINCIPTEARAKVDLRSERAERIDEMASILGACVAQAAEAENSRATGGRVVARLKEIGSRPGGDLQEGAPILNCVLAVDAFLGIRSYLDCSSTDANIPLSLGIPALSIGAGGQGGGAHTSGEWFHPEGRELGLRRILLALCLLLLAE
ncbi:MAG TPA: M20/M25/M40 family metallo-hydrolase [Bryobacteraceae bacterium]|jgi:acetylornithine deacetylase/succinyl-diaminopimelate desuccinylase-like protein